MDKGISPITIDARIHGCCLGQSIGGTLGLPAKGKMTRLDFTFHDPVPTLAPPNDDLELQLVSHGGGPVAWANRELPPQVKAAQGATWIWNVAHEEPRELICPAREGARLYLDDKLVVECLSGLPYVPATHRSTEG